MAKQVAVTAENTEFKLSLLIKELKASRNSLKTAN